MKNRALLLAIVLLVMTPVLMGAAQENIVSIGKSATVEEGAYLATNVVVIGADATIKGTVAENVVVIFGNIYLEPTAVVRGDTVAVGGSVIRQPGSTVYGENVSVNVGTLPQYAFRPGRYWPIRMGWGTRSIWTMLSVVFLGWAVFWLFPKNVTKVAVVAEAEPLKAVLYGLLGYLAVIPVSIMLLITIIGILFIPFVWIGVLVGRFLGQVALGLLVGRHIFTYLKREESPAVHVVVGLLTLGLITLLPVVGSLASLFFGLLGFGAVLWTRFGREQHKTGEVIE